MGFVPVCNCPSLSVDCPCPGLSVSLSLSLSLSALLWTVSVGLSVPVSVRSALLVSVCLSVCPLTYCPGRAALAPKFVGGLVILPGRTANSEAGGTPQGWIAVFRKAASRTNGGEGGEPEKWGVCLVKEKNRGAEQYGRTEQEKQGQRENREGGLPWLVVVVAVF